jgi:hypothetical protein
MEATRIEPGSINTSEASFTYNGETYFVKIRAHSHINGSSRVVSWESIDSETAKLSIIQKVALAFLNNLPTHNFNRASIHFEGRTRGKIDYFNDDTKVNTAHLEKDTCSSLTSLSQRHLKIDIQPARSLIRGIKRPDTHKTCYAISLAQMMANTYKTRLNHPFSRHSGETVTHHQNREALRIKFLDLLENLQSDVTDTSQSVHEDTITALMKCMHTLHSDARWNVPTQEHDVLELFSRICYQLELPNIGEKLLNPDSTSAVEPYVSIKPPKKDAPSTKVSTLMSMSTFSLRAQKQWTNADTPDLLPVHINRSKGAAKTQTQVEIDGNLTFDTQDGKVQYVLDSCIVHKGETASTGHYVTYRFIDGTFCECNDDKIKEVDNEEFQRVASKNGYLVLYKKWTAPIRVEEVD